MSITVEVTRTVTVEPKAAFLVRNMMATLARETPDRKSKAKLVLDNKPECPVGAALARLGVPVEALAQVGGAGSPLIAGQDTDDRKWIRWFQQTTDAGQTWGSALVGANAYAQGLVEGRQSEQQRAAKANSTFGA